LSELPGASYGGPGHIADRRTGCSADGSQYDCSRKRPKDRVSDSFLCKRIQRCEPYCYHGHGKNLLHVSPPFGNLLCASTRCWLNPLLAVAWLMANGGNIEIGEALNRIRFE
jgi:hypothetical protein